MGSVSSVNVRFDAAGLVPAIVQHARTGAVLMLGYMNQEALERTLSSGRVWFYSRSRQALWLKGETSGHYLNLRQIRIDCDGDALLVLAEPEGPTCHTGQQSCFSETLAGAATVIGGEFLDALFQTILQRRRERPAGSYVASLFEGGVDRIAKKVGEEATEAVIAAKNGNRQEVAWEVADLWFHSLVMLAEAGLTPDDIWAELARRRR